MGVPIFQKNPRKLFAGGDFLFMMENYSVIACWIATATAKKMANKVLLSEIFATFVVTYEQNTESVSLFSLVNVGNLSSSENERTSSYVVPIWVMAWDCCLFVLQGFPTTYQIK